MLPETWLLDRIGFLIPLVLSLTVHEWAHAYTAWLLGDDTAKCQGRMTLNPISHMDPIGTLALPLLGIPFGWAKPVPVEPIRFHRGIRMETGLLLTALAGPISNIVLALAAAAGLGALHWGIAPAGGMFRQVAELLEWLVTLNLLLAFLNLLPIPPLDGSRIADGLMPDRARPAWDALASYAPLALAALLVVPFVLGVNLFAWPMNAALALVRAVVGGA